MRKLPSRGRGLLREEFYSIHSVGLCPECPTEKHGRWSNVWAVQPVRLRDMSTAVEMVGQQVSEGEKKPEPFRMKKHYCAIHECLKKQSRYG